jgi:hypothetical protein
LCVFRAPLPTDSVNSVNWIRFPLNGFHLQLPTATSARLYPIVPVFVGTPAPTINTKRSSTLRAILLRFRPWNLQSRRPHLTNLLGSRPLHLQSAPPPFSYTSFCSYGMPSISAAPSDPQFRGPSSRSLGGSNHLRCRLLPVNF